MAIPFQKKERKFNDPDSTEISKVSPVIVWAIWVIFAISIAYGGTFIPGTGSFLFNLGTEFIAAGIFSVLVGASMGGQK